MNECNIYRDDRTYGMKVSVNDILRMNWLNIKNKNDARIVIYERYARPSATPPTLKHTID
jgi:hypothetical protein